MTNPSSADERALPPSELPLRDLLAQSSNVMRWAAERAAFAGQAPRAAAEAHAFADALGDMADKIRDGASLGAAQAPAQLQAARDALEEIALAGMSGSGQESEDGLRDWHARRAWEFIGIAARALDDIKCAPEPTAGAAQVPSLSDAKDAARWNMLPAFFEEYQIDAMKLYRDIDAALSQPSQQNKEEK